jgi:hypothetical protein
MLSQSSRRPKTTILGKGEWDIAIGPRVLAPADKADVTSDIWPVDLLYVAAKRQEFAEAGQVDRIGVKVGAIQSSPSYRFLTRALKSAKLVRLPLSPNSRPIQRRIR